jgi:hypothetical protein
MILSSSKISLNRYALSTPKKMEKKLERLQKELGRKVHREMEMQIEINELKMKVDGLKRLLEGEQGYEELRNSISNISEVIMGNKMGKIKEEHRVLLKGLVDENSLTDKLKLLCQKLRCEIRRSHETYGIARKYISTIKTCHKMQKDFVDISDYINNAEMEAEEDLEKIEQNQLLTTQNNNIVRQSSDGDFLDIDTSPSKRWEKSLFEKDKEISRLQHELDIMKVSKNRASQFHSRGDSRKPRSAKIIDEKLSNKSTKSVPAAQSNLKVVNSGDKRKKYKRDKSASHFATESLQAMEEESDPEPSNFLDVGGLVSHVPHSSR